VDQPELVPTVAASYVSGHRSGGAGGAKPAPARRIPKGFLAETAPGWTTWKRCRSNRCSPEAPRSYSRGHTQTRRSVCVFDAPGGAPRRISPTATCLTPLLKRRMLISPLFPGRSPGRRSLERDAGLRRGQVQPLPPKRQARRGRVARKRARCVRRWTAEAGSRSRASGSDGRAVLSKLSTVPMSVQQKRACDDGWLKPG
jgi:hypothetical protein